MTDLQDDNLTALINELNQTVDSWRIDSYMIEEYFSNGSLRSVARYYVVLQGTEEEGERYLDLTDALTRAIERGK